MLADVSIRCRASRFLNHEPDEMSGFLGYVSIRCRASRFLNPEEDALTALTSGFNSLSCEQVPEPYHSGLGTKHEFQFAVVRAGS